MSDGNSNYNRLTTLTAVIFLSAFCAFIFFYEQHEQCSARSRIAQHGIIISNALWNLDPQGAVEYLALACRYNNYRKIVVKDTKGELFQIAEGQPSGFIERAFTYIGLIPDVDLSADISYNNKRIGTIEAVWKCDTIYLELYVCFALILLYAVLTLNIHLFKSRNLLERRVRERTKELSIVNASLKFEVEEHRQARDALRNSEEKYRILIENIPDILYRTDIEGVIVFISRSCESVSGYTVDEVMGKKITDLFYVDNSERDSFYSLLDKNGYVNNFESKLRRKDGSIWWASTNAHFFRNSEGNISGIEGVFRDVTGRKRLESELRQAQKMESIGTLTGGIAHDFNNILGIMIGNAELAMDSIPRWNAAYVKIEAIKTAGQRASGIVKQLLSFSRKTDMELKPIDLVNIIKESIALLKATIPSSIAILSYLPDEDVSILGNPTQINQIIINLCINAAQAMEGMEGEIRIRVERGASMEMAESLQLEKDMAALSSTSHSAGPLHISQPLMQNDDEAGIDCDNAIKRVGVAIIKVEDTGPGIESSIIDRIFDPYFTTKSVDKGTGMGLAVVHGIVQNHNGMISVNSTPGKGTTFTVMFQMVSEESCRQSDDDSSAELYSGSEKILFVDDEPFITEMTQEMLERLGYRVVSLTEPEEALDLFSKAPFDFDIVITDMTMPQMTGAKLARSMQEIRPDIPIVICSGYSSMIDEESAREAGIAAYMMKPISMNDMGTTIRAVLDRSKAG